MTRTIAIRAALAAVAVAFLSAPWWTPESWWTFSQYEQQICVERVTYLDNGRTVYTTDAHRFRIYDGIVIERGACYTATIDNMGSRQIPDVIRAVEETP